MSSPTNTRRSSSPTQTWASPRPTTWPRCGSRSRLPGGRRAPRRAAPPTPAARLPWRGAGGASQPDPGCDWQLLAGDESALPAICSALEALPADAHGIAYLETCDPGEDLDV